MAGLLNAVVAWLLTTLFFQTFAIELDIDSPDSIRAAAKTVAHGLQSIYNGNQTGGTLGKFPYPPYYWWESGAAWGGMVNYWHYTGDDTWASVTQEALVSQLSETNDFMEPAERFDLGNDDQAFWALAAMSAAEYSFPAPPAPHPDWLTICANVFNDYVSRWNTSTCGGGLKWQIYPENNGYTYKNAISNGGFFQLGARLARATGNQSYVEWVNKVYDWSTTIGLVDSNYNVYDGTDETINCTQVNHMQWSYNVAMFLYGSAVMSNYTNGSDLWTTRTTGFLNAAKTFFSPFSNATDIMFEAACETQGTCNTDQFSQKAYMSRWLASTAVLAPYTAGQVGELLRTSAKGAAASCSGGADGTQCGSRWYINGFDGSTGLGQQMSAMEVMYTLLVNSTKPPAVISGNENVG
ncbi:MAG: hypothetical protein Q9160_001499 [Pyrenula sp. 1 TL-2023]